MENPTRLSPTRRTIPFEIIDRASELWRQRVEYNLRPEDRDKFAAAMEREGHGAVLQNGRMNTSDVDTTREMPRMPSFLEKIGDEVPSNLEARQQLPEKLFVVHGRDNATKNEVALFLRTIGLEPIILHLRPNGGRHLLTKFAEESEGAGFAVVQMTPDDEGGLNGTGDRRPRARQNVVFELGFFTGKLGTAKVAALLKGDVEKPSDFDGIAYISFDAGGKWKTELARELHHVGVPFDPAKALSA